MAEAPQQQQQQQEEEPNTVEATEETDEGSEELKESTQTAPTRPLLSMRSMSTVDPDDDSPNMIVYRKYMPMCGSSFCHFHVTNAMTNCPENFKVAPSLCINAQFFRRAHANAERECRLADHQKAAHSMRPRAAADARSRCCVDPGQRRVLGEVGEMAGTAGTELKMEHLLKHVMLQRRTISFILQCLTLHFSCKLYQGLLATLSREDSVDWNKNTLKSVRRALKWQSYRTCFNCIFFSLSVPVRLAVLFASLSLQIEDIVTHIQDETEGVPIRTVKSFMTKIPSVVTGADIVQWLMKNLSIEDPAEAMHIGSLIAAQGYFFPISDHVLSLKDDGTFYRFQAPYFWPSNCWEPENTDYAIYLCKRTMQNKTRLELADYEAENLARLQRAFARKWEFIYMQAEAQVKIDRKKDKTERKILDSQERAFWDVHRPVPGCVNTTEMDIRKCRRMKNPHRVKKILFLNTQLDRHCMKMSKVAESLISYTEQYMEYDPFVTAPEPSNPWTSDDPSLWDLEASKEPSQQRVKKWGFSLEEALKDPAGQELFLKFLESEFSSENLRFWLAVQDLKRMPQQDVAQRAQDIWAEFLAEGAPSSINLDSHSYERTSQNLKDPGRYSYEDAQDHIYKLMKSDSYTRFLRSNVYQDLLMARKKVMRLQRPRFGPM
ncbi:hypothetical protein L3Q82_010973 [Scortum barcoo]|uniref:Uncharacterized protein n=1 Tax=Scortum barcoo TaxID=214431 RepID=A0ACB8W8U2_9TELE|nr:hypothetical protein L3Q82_010973 [Scortum barcoo]